MYPEFKKFSLYKEASDSVASTDTYSYSRELVKKQIQLEEDAVRNALKNHLKYEPTEEDYKKCHRMVSEGIDNQYGLLYEDVPVGTFRRAFEGYFYKIYFTPGAIVFQLNHQI